MAGKRKQYNIPDRETILKYLKGGLSASDRHRIEKLMLENPVFADMIEGLESHDPNIIESDLRELSSSVPSTDISFDRSWSVYRIAATILLLTVSGIVLFFLITDVPIPFGKSNISMNQEIFTDSSGQDEIIENPDVNDDLLKEESKTQQTKILAVPDEEEIVEPPIKDQDNLPEEQQEMENLISEPEIGENINETDAFEESEMPLTEDPDPAAGISYNDPDNEQLIPPQEKEESEDEDDSFQFEETVNPSAVALSGVSDEQGAGEEKAKKARAVQNTAAVMSDESVPATKEVTPVNGYDNFRKYLGENLSYPEAAANAGIEGTVKLNFVVGLDSIPSQFNVEKSLGFGCDQEAIRLLREGPKWVPAINNNQPVEMETSVEINFKLGE